MQRNLGFNRAPGRACGFGGALALGLLLIGSGQARAQEPVPTPMPPAAPAEDERSTGLPELGTWTFNLDIGMGGFGFANSLYKDVRSDPSGDLSDNWAESFAKPAVSASFGAGRSELYGKLSAVGERTFAAPPTLVGSEASSFQVEDAYLGWRSGKSLGTSENLLEFTVGRTPYKVGHGFLLWDGAAEGGSRGGFWSNARKAWGFAAVGRVKPKNHTLEAFYLDRSDIPESDDATRLWGANYELAVGEKSTFGATYMKFNADQGLLPARDGLNVYNVRAYTSPLRSVPDLFFELEYAREQNGDLVRSNAWTAQAGYELSQVAWKPKALLPLCLLRGRRSRDTEERGFRFAAAGLLRLGHVVAGRDRRRVLPGQLQPELAPAAPPPDSQQVRERRAHRVPVPARPAGRIRAAGDVEGCRLRARRILRLEAEQELHRQLRCRVRGPTEGDRAGL